MNRDGHEDNLGSTLAGRKGRKKFNSPSVDENANADVGVVCDDDNNENDADVIDKDGIIDEKTLQLFARMALHSRINNRKYNSDLDDNGDENIFENKNKNKGENEMELEGGAEDRKISMEGKYDQLLHMLPIGEFHVSLEPAGNQGLIWSEGDILHYWKYTVFPSIKNVSSVGNSHRVDGRGGGDSERNSLQGEHSSDKGCGGDEQDDDDEYYINKFYSPIVSAKLTARWTDIGYIENASDFEELKVVRHKRLTEREIDEIYGDCIQNDDANSDNENGRNEVSQEDSNNRELDKKRRPSIVGRRGFSSLGFTTLGIAGCVSAPDLDPNVRPRARTRKSKSSGKQGEETEGEEGVIFDEDDEAILGPGGIKTEDVLLQDDWINIPGSGHHTYKGETFESLQQEDWTNTQVRHGTVHTQDYSMS